MFCSHEEAELFKYHKQIHFQSKIFPPAKVSFDLSARLSVRSLILALLTALTSAECTLSASGHLSTTKMF